jgi:hypothetical protein
MQLNNDGEKGTVGSHVFLFCDEIVPISCSRNSSTCCRVVESWPRKLMKLTQSSCPGILHARLGRLVMMHLNGC